jgi:hypothetical protein
MGIQSMIHPQAGSIIAQHSGASRMGEAKFGEDFGAIVVRESASSHVRARAG